MSSHMPEKYDECWPVDVFSGNYFKNVSEIYWLIIFTPQNNVVFITISQSFYFVKLVNVVIFILIKLEFLHLTAAKTFLGNIGPKIRYILWEVPWNATVSFILWLQAPRY
jgi:hypothetical protein